MKKNILIYDDDEDILLLCKAILSKYGLTMESSPNSQHWVNVAQPQIQKFSCGVSNYN